MPQTLQPEFPQTKVYTFEAAILKSLGHPLRIKILYELNNKKCNVTTLSGLLGIHQATMSYHLAILRHLGAITGERNSTEVFYSIENRFVKQLLSILEL